MPTTIGDVPRFAWIALAFGAICLAYFLKYVGRYRQDRHPERHGGRSLGRYGGRFFWSGAGTAISIPLVVMGLHLGSWQEYGASVSMGTVKASVKGDAIRLTVLLRGQAPREVDLRGRHWVVRADVLAFNPSLAVLGLRNHYRVRAAEGLADRSDRITGAHVAREELSPRSPLFTLLRALPAMPWLVVARDEATPAKQGGEAELFLTSGGSAG